MLSKKKPLLGQNGCVCAICASAGVTAEMGDGLVEASGVSDKDRYPTYLDQ